MDLEISSLEPIILYNPRKDKPLHASIGYLTKLAFFPLVFLLSFTKRFIPVFVREGFFRRHCHWHYAIGLLLSLFMWDVSCSSVLHLVYTWLWINCTGSLIFCSIGVNAAHHHPDAIKDGDQPRSESLDWGIHQLQALLDRRTINSNVFAVVTMFGDHALHHIFPTFNHALLKYLHPVFLDFCEKYQATTWCPRNPKWYLDK